MATPSSPSSAIFATISAGHRPDLSSSAAFGATSRAAKSRADAWIIRCSSVSSNSIAPTLSSRPVGLQLHESGDLGGAGPQARLGADGDADASLGEHRDVEGVVAERGVERALPHVLAQPHDLAARVGDGTVGRGEHDVALEARVRGDDAREVEAEARAA